MRHLRSISLAVAALTLINGCTCRLPRRQGVMYCTGSGTNTDQSRHIYRVEQFDTAPQAVDLGASGERLTDIAIDRCTARAYAITIDKLFSVDLASGKLHLIGPLTGLTGLNSLETTCGGLLYVWGFSDTRIFSVDPVSLSTQPVADTKHEGGDLALSPDGGVLFGTTLDNRLVRVDLAAKTATSVALTNAPDRIPGLDFGPDGQLYGVLGNDFKGAATVCRVDAKSGAVTIIGPVANAQQLGNGGMSIIW